MEFNNISESKYPEIVKALLEKYADVKIWTFEGNLGAGKTTFIKATLKALGYTDEVQSPTFSIVNEYGDSVYHFDCYRLKSVYEAMDFGIEEYLDSGKYCFIEWPEIIEPLLPNEILKIKIEHTENNTRNIAINLS
ncbi:tRNA (adenosine(37)-N6)-threonylcarbamoyltransferase complex ATPase subunit type 1 TsaE [Lacihabitans lacunae]|uniref:tRNA threonylcarbamoyladenosine biosynthesis protein TsaE n=1 Tax=Lacihabitans lacunae TaxID=1028214 RepID=A0ABV7YRF6_9BACT